MFGYWKRAARTWEAEAHRIYEEAGAANDDLRRKLAEERSANVQLAKELLGAETDLAIAVRNRGGFIAGVSDKLKTTQAELSHAQHCYEQCEADRLAIAVERDEARKQRDEAMARLNNIAPLVRGLMGAFGGIPNHTTEPTNARPDASPDASPDDRPGAVPDGCDARPEGLGDPGGSP